MDWSSVGIGASIIGAVSGIAFWFWPRRKPLVPLSNRSVHDISHAGIAIVGDGNVIHSTPLTPVPNPALLAETLPPIPFIVLPTADNVPPLAGTTVDEFSLLLKSANNFRRRELIAFYNNKTFRITGIVNDKRMYSQSFIVSLNHPAISLNVTFPLAAQDAFAHINDDTWYLEVDAELDQNMFEPSPNSMFFTNPTRYRLMPAHLHNR